jgi:hypothetical protein
MKLIKLLFLLILSGLLFSDYAQTITSATSGIWGDGATWVGGNVPDSSKNVIIAAAHTVTVNVESNCNNITFNATTSKLIMNANLNCYGNVNRFDNLASNHFTSWTAGAKFKFTGYAATQTITNLGTTSGTPNWPFRMNEIVIDKNSGKFMTSSAGGDYKLGIGTSLDVVKGTFELASTDDIEGRDIAANATTPAIIVRAGAIFNMVGSSSHIRRGNFTGDETEKIGQLTIFGSFYLACGTTNRASFTNVSIESGGVLYNTTGRGQVANSFNPGTVTVKSGGTFYQSTTTNVWYTNITTPTTMDLQDGGIFVAYSSTLPFPPNINNNGTVKYASASFDQTITDVNYSRLELSYTGSGAYKKNWTLGANRVISDSLETNNSAILVLSAASAQTLTINGTLRLTSGSINNSNPNVTLIFGNSTEISKATGTITNTPTFSGTINLKYSSSSLVTTGLEMPSGAGVLNNLSVTGIGGIYLASSPTVNGILSLSGGKIFLGSNNLTVAGSITGAGPANYVVSDGTGGLIRNVSSSDVSFPIGFTDTFTPVVLNNSGTADDFTISVKNTFDNAPYTNEVVNKQWIITEGTPGGSDATVKLQWNAADENPLFVRTNPVFIGRYTGSVWEEISASYADLGGGVYTASVGGFMVFSPFTVGNMSSLPVELSLFTTNVNGKDVSLNWTTKTEKNSNKFEIERLDNLIWINIGSVRASVLSNSPKQYSYVDKNLQTGKYQYRLKMIDNDGTFQYSKIVETEVSRPKNFGLSQNYPNPFNPETIIRFEIPKASDVNISIYNIVGQKVATLINEFMDAGYYQRAFSSNLNGINLSSGTYFYVLKAGNVKMIKKMILMK